MHLQPGSLGLEESSHVLDTEDVDALMYELVDEVKVVLERVLRLLGAGDIAAVADDSLTDTTGLLCGIDTELQVLCKGPINN